MCYRDQNIPRTMALQCSYFFYSADNQLVTGARGGSRFAILRNPRSAVIETKRPFSMAAYFYMYFN